MLILEGLKENRDTHQRRNRILDVEIRGKTGGILTFKR